MKIEYYRKNVYGRELLYFLDQEVANHWLRLTGRQTLTEQDIPHLQALGFVVEEVLAPRS